MYIITISKPLIFISNDGDNNTDKPFSLRSEIMMVQNTPKPVLCPLWMMTVKTVFQYLT